MAYSLIEEVKHVEELKHRAFKEALIKYNITSDIEIHTMADLPAKSGLGSSSTFAVALLKLLSFMNGQNLSGLDLAKQSISFEQDSLNDSVGSQDQCFAACGGLNLVRFKRNDISLEKCEIDKETLRELEDHLLVVFTGVTRSASDVASAQISKISANLHRYAKMKEQVDQGLSILRAGKDLSDFGYLLDEAWKEKSRLHSNVSTSLIDEMYQVARHAGAYGGKLLGAGSGVFFCFLRPKLDIKKLSTPLNQHPTSTQNLQYWC